MLERHTTQALHLLWYIESGANSICWVECLHLLLRAGETQHRHCICCCDLLKVGQTCIAINWVECLHIATCWERHTTQALWHLLWLIESVCYCYSVVSGLSALTLITTGWRGTQHKHYIYCDSLVEQTVLVIAIEWRVWILLNLALLYHKVYVRVDL